MEVSQQVFYSVGVVTSTVFIVLLVYQIFTNLKLYVFPKIGRQKDYVSEFGKWAVITGGSDGIGKQYALDLAKRGMNICVISNFENGIVQTIKSQYDVEVKWMNIDFSSPEIYVKVEKELSQLDDIGILINNVGMVNQEPLALAETDRKFLLTILNVNLTSTMLMTEIVLKEMVRRDRGLIVNISSITAWLPLPYFTMYCSIKSCITNYSTCLAVELSSANSKVRVKCLEPFFVKTQLVKGVSAVIRFLENLPVVRTTVVDAPSFAVSAVATFGVNTPVVYSGYWTHQLLNSLIPYYLGASTIANFIVWLIKYLKLIK